MSQFPTGRSQRQIVSSKLLPGVPKPQSDEAASITQGLGRIPKLLVRNQEQVEGQLLCFDRVIFQSTLVEVAHLGALASYLVKAGRKPSGLVAFAQPLNEQIRENAERLAWEIGSGANISIEGIFA